MKYEQVEELLPLEHKHREETLKELLGRAEKELLGNTFVKECERVWEKMKPKKNVCEFC